MKIESSVETIKTILKGIGLNRWSAIVTWAFITASSVYFMFIKGDYPLWQMWTFLGCSLVFIFCFLINTGAIFCHLNQKFTSSLLLVELAAILAIYFIVPYGYVVILMMMLSIQLLYLLSLRKAIVIATLLSTPAWLVYEFYWEQEHALFSALLYWLLNFFAIVTVDTSIKEQQAKERAQNINRELVATQNLLAEATKQSERLRISRNIHDLLGHHLTALTINLQVASRKTEGEVHQQIDKCHSIAKLLLSDVREAVSEIRDKSSIELKHTIQVLMQSVPNLDISLEYSDEVHIQDVALADTIVRCVQESITNTLKHARADKFSICLDKQGSNLVVQLKDNGSIGQEIEEGNGLTGMRERIEAFKGKIQFNPSSSGLETLITIPEYV